MISNSDIINKFIDFSDEQNCAIDDQSFNKFCLQNEVSFAYSKYLFPKGVYSVVLEYVGIKIHNHTFDSDLITGFANKVKSSFLALILDFDESFLLRMSKLLAIKPLYLGKISYKIASFIMKEAGGDMSFNYYSKRVILSGFISKFIIDNATSGDLNNSIESFNIRIDNLVSTIGAIKRKFYN